MLSFTPAGHPQQTPLTSWQETPSITAITDHLVCSQGSTLTPCSPQRNKISTKTIAVKIFYVGHLHTKPFNQSSQQY